MGPTVASHIACKPSVCGGKPCIAGTRIRVQDVYDWHEREGFSPDEIVTRFPQLTLADVYAALAYYWDHREAIERARDEDRDFVEAMKASIPSKLGCAMDIHLSEDARRFIADEVASGRYSSEDAVIDAALRRLRQEETSAPSGRTLEEDPLWGMFRDEPELIDRIVQDAMRDRQSVPSREE